MRTAGWLISSLVMLALAAGSHAQGLVILNPRLPIDPDPPVHRRKHVIYLGNSGYLGAFSAMPYCAYSVTRVSFFQPAPPVMGPFFPPFTPVRQGVVLEPDLANLFAVRRPRFDPPVLPLLIDPGEPASIFRPILPEDRMRAQQPEKAEMPPPPPVKKALPPAPKGNAPKPEPKPLPGFPAANANPKTENLRQIKMGREAFANREYGRAERRFQQATQALPQESLGCFLLSQAQFAQGKYAEAVASIQAGMRLHANWPAALFWPRDLYEGNGADYAEQLKNLADALAHFPNDPILLFLYGYQLWFDDRRDEAKPFFVRAAAGSADPSFSHCFVPPPPPVPRLPFMIW